jgi:uncharacterized protein YuzE
MAGKKTSVETFYLTQEGPALPVQITVDRAAKAVYVRVRLGKVARTVEVEEGVLADVDHLGLLLGFEILRPGHVKVFDRMARTYKVPELKAVGSMAEALCCA